MDALGRTGTAVERDGETLVIDPNNGQLLADTQGDPTRGVSCGNGCTEYGVAYTYVSEGRRHQRPRRLRPDRCVAASRGGSGGGSAGAVGEDKGTRAAPGPVRAFRPR